MSDRGGLVRFAGVVHVYRASGIDVAALRGIDLTVPSGQQLALLGPSGSGKSTLLTLLAGVLRPSAGTITVDNDDIGSLTEAGLRHYRAHTVGTVLQGGVANLLAYGSARDNVVLAQRAGTSRPERQSPAELLSAVGLARSDHTQAVSRLSPAKQQLAAVAVALANAPRVVIADEPTSHLDDRARDTVMNTLTAVGREMKATVIVVTHDPAVADHMDRMVHLSGGRIGAEGRQDERLAVFGADHALSVPEDLVSPWAAGDRLKVERLSDDEIRITREP